MGRYKPQLKTNLDLEDGSADSGHNRAALLRQLVYCMGLLKPQQGPNTRLTSMWPFRSALDVWPGIYGHRVRCFGTTASSTRLEDCTFLQLGIFMLVEIVKMYAWGSRGSCSEMWVWTVWRGSFLWYKLRIPGSGGQGYLPQESMDPQARFLRCIPARKLPSPLLMLLDAAVVAHPLHSANIGLQGDIRPYVVDLTSEGLSQLGKFRSMAVSRLRQTMEATSASSTRPATTTCT